MLTYEDCLCLCELTQDEIDAIAQHEHMTEMAALELGNYLVQTPDGVHRIKRMIIDDIREAERRANLKRVLLLKLALRHFVESHPARSVQVPSR